MNEAQAYTLYIFQPTSCTATLLHSLGLVDQEKKETARQLTMTEQVAGKECNGQNLHSIPRANIQYPSRSVEPNQRVGPEHDEAAPESQSDERQSCMNERAWKSRRIFSHSRSHGGGNQSIPVCRNLLFAAINPRTIENGN